jgi:peptidyl-prolyl cis-trans isomerase C
MQRSTDAATRFNGGDLGYFSLSAMPEAYGVALKDAKPGAVVGPFRTDAGFVVARVEDRRAEQPLSLEAARPQIVRFLTYDEIRTLLTRLRSGVQIQMLAPSGAPAPAAAPSSPKTPNGSGADPADRSAPGLRRLSPAPDDRKGRS